MIGVQSAQSRSLTVVCVRVVQVFIAAVAVYKLGPARPNFTNNKHFLFTILIKSNHKLFDNGQTTV